MAGHNKWSKIKRSKGVLDVKRGTLFSKLSKEITLAAKVGGRDADTNFRLRTAIQSARSQNMPSDNIERAIKKGTGELESQAIEELNYEGYAPGGIAVLIEAATDNRHRTAADLRLIFSKHHGNLATSGSVGYLFHKQGEILLPLQATQAIAAKGSKGGNASLLSTANEEEILELVLEAGADEFELDGDYYRIVTAPDRLNSVSEVLRSKGFAAETMKLTYVPENTVAVSDPSVAQQILHLCDALEECDDVQNVHANFDISEELLARLTA